MSAPTILVLNAGSSSLKFALYDTAAHGSPKEFCRGEVSGITSEARLTIKGSGEAGAQRTVSTSAPDHECALQTVVEHLKASFPDLKIAAVGHRIVHGGPDFDKPVILSSDIIRRLEALIPLAPLHQPHNLAAIRAVESAFGVIPQIACFDTAFHRHHPWVNDTFALPRSFYEEGIRRYGFHGLSYEFVSTRLAETNPALSEGRVVIAHLGNGASMCALRAGRSIASTMGFTALDGLPMGTRCGQLDPGVVLYLLEEKGMSARDIADLLYTKSGLRGLSGVSHDMRALEASMEPEAQEAIDYFVFRIRRELGAMAAALGGLDALIFTGGIGENSPHIRAKVTDDMSWLGLGIDPRRNASDDQDITSSGAACGTLVLPTNEEIVIARAVLDCLKSDPLVAEIP